MTRRRHPKKAVEEAIRHAESLGWRVKLGSGHVWARLLCPFGHPDCLHTVSSTPQNADGHAKRLRRLIDRCPGGDAPRDPEE